jgi:hypothetical protein
VLKFWFKDYPLEYSLKNQSDSGASVSTENHLQTPGIAFFGIGSFYRYLSFCESSNMSDSEHVDEPVQTQAKRRNFLFAEDFALIAEVVDFKPMHGGAGHTWDDLAAAMEDNFPYNRGAKGYKCRYDILLKKFKAKDAKARWASGTAEQVTEIKKMLQECEEMQREADQSALTKTQDARAKKQRLLSDKEKGIKIRGDSLQTLKSKTRKIPGNVNISESENESDADAVISPERVNKRRMSKTVIEEELARKWSKESSLEEGKLALENKRLVLEEKRHQDQVDLRKMELAIEKQRLDMEKQKLDMEQERRDQARHNLLVQDL